MKRIKTILGLLIFFAVLSISSGNAYAAEEKLKIPHILSVVAEDNTIKLTFTDGEGFQHEGGEWVYKDGYYQYVKDEPIYLAEDGYEIWRGENGSANYTLVKILTKAEAGKSLSDDNEYVYFDRNLNWGTKYTYKLRAYKNDASVQGGLLYSEYDNKDGSGLSVRLYSYAVKEPEFCRAKGYYNCVELLFPYGNDKFYYEYDGITEDVYGYYYGGNYLSACTGYEIWRKNIGVDTDYRKVTDVEAVDIFVLGKDGFTYTDKTLDWNGTYSYKVRSYRLDSGASGGRVYSNFIVPENGTNIRVDGTKVNNIWTLGKNKSISIMWDGVTDDEITSYNLYRSTSKNGKYTKIATVGAQNAYSTFEGGKTKSYYQYTNTKLSNNKTYYYKVSANKKSENKNEFESKLSAYTSGKPNAKYKEATVTELEAPHLVTPKIKTAKTVGKGKIRLYWGRNNQADGYVIYRATSKNGKYKAVKTIKSTKTTSVTINAAKGKTYYYRLAAFANVKSHKIYSSKSAAKKIKCSR